jgi:hypothetical protein
MYLSLNLLTRLASITISQAHRPPMLHEMERKKDWKKEKKESEQRVKRPRITG